MVTAQEKAYLTSFWEELLQVKKELAAQEMPKLTKEAFYLFHETGNRLVYETLYFGRRKYLTVYGILAEFGKAQEDIDRLGEIMEAVCEERCWALPAHVDSDSNLFIDLFAAETAQTLMELAVLFADRLPARILERVKKEVLTRVLLPFCNSAFPYSWWETDRCNWSAVCAGSVGMAAIYMSRMEPQPAGMAVDWKENCIRRVCDALQCYLDGMEEDGACTEGLGYYAYGMSYYTAFAELLYEDSKQTIDLMKNPKCEPIAAFQEKCYFGKGVSLSFSDGSSSEKFLPGLTAYLAHCFPIQTPDYRLARPFEEDACYRWLTNERNIRWLLQYGGQESAKQQERSYALLPAAQWLIAKDANGNGYAMKGGHNAENHNHNDIGHFLCVYEGEMLLTDLGAGEYTKEYFGAGRYDILCNRSLGHSVPLIHGKEQCAGREYQAQSFIWDEERQELEVSFAGAYPKGIVERVTRRICMEHEQLLIVDKFTANQQTEWITENLITQFPAFIETDHSIRIEGHKGICRISMEGCTIENLRVIAKEHSRHDGKKEMVSLLQWDIPAPAQETISCRMRLLFEKNI